MRNGNPELSVILVFTIPEDENPDDNRQRLDQRSGLNQPVKQFAELNFDRC
jgi:hypothetical protein